MNDALIASMNSVLNSGSVDSQTHRPDPLSSFQMMVGQQEKETGGIKQTLQELSTLDLGIRKGLTAFGPRYLPVYITGIESELDKGTAGNFRFLLALLDIVGEFGCEAIAAVPVLVTVLKKNGGTVSEFAASALGAIGGQDAVDALTYVRDKTQTIKERKNLFFTKEKAEHEFDGDLRRTAADALGKLGHQ